jgi:hypothetical protein
MSTKESTKKNRKGETRMANCGLMMTIIEYRNAKKGGIDIMFEDSTIVKNATYSCFKTGCVKHPKFNNNNISFPEFFVGYLLKDCGFKKYPQGYLKKFNKEWGKRELDLFNETLKIAIEYDGGYFHKDIKKDLFKNQLCYKDKWLLFRIREKGLPNLNSSSIDYIREDKNSFLELYHIVGYIIDEINNIFGTQYTINFKLEDLEYIKKEFAKTRIDYNKYIADYSHI